MQYGFSTKFRGGFDEAIVRATEELQKEGFGVLTTIDVKETLKKKLGIERERYVILGACNPGFAHQVLTAEPEIGLLLPCNVIVYESNGGVTVSAFNPEAMAAVISNPAVEPIARDVGERLQRVIANLSS